MLLETMKTRISAARSSQRKEWLALLCGGRKNRFDAEVVKCRQSKV
jgi:hypothetical protein